MKYHKKRQRKRSADSPKGTSRQPELLSGSEPLEDREDEGRTSISPTKQHSGPRDEQAPDSEREGGTLNTKLTEYLNEIWRRRAELNNPKKVFIPWKSPENLDAVSAKKKKPLVLLDENNRQPNRTGKEIMQRSLELALQSCTLLAKRNALAVDSRDEDSKGDQAGRSSREASGNKGNSRVERNRRMAAKQSAELNRSMTIKGSRSTKRFRTQGTVVRGKKRVQQANLEEPEATATRGSGSRTGRAGPLDSEDTGRDKPGSLTSERSATEQEDGLQVESSKRQDSGVVGAKRNNRTTGIARVRKSGKVVNSPRGRRTGAKTGPKHKGYKLKRNRVARVVAGKKAARGRPKGK